MAITYPLELAAFYDAIGGWSNSFELLTYQTLTGLADGSVISAQRATPKWGGNFTITPKLNRANVGVEALLHSLKGSVGSFKAYDMRRAYPLNDPDGSMLTNGSVLALGDVSASGVVSSATYTYEGSAVTIGQATPLTRSSTATYIDVSGVMQTAAVDELRFDYSTGAKMMLIEAAATNLVTYSQQFDNAAWGKGEVTVTANAVASPDGTTTADKIIPSVVSGAHKALSAAASVTNAEVYTLSFFAKSAGYDYVRISGEGTGFSASDYQLFNLAIGSLGISSSVVSSGIVSLGGGWFRCWASITATATNSGQLAAYVSNTNTNNAFAGDGTSGVYIWGAQIELGSSPTSYVPTTSAAVTRAADVLTFRGKGTNDWTLTFDNAATQSFANEVDDLAITASALTRPNIKSWSAIRDTQPAAAAVKIKSVGSNNKSLALKGLPPFYQLAVGDYISFVYSSTLVALHQVLEVAMADYLGETAEFEVTPFIRTGAAAENVVTLVKPYGLFRLVPGSYQSPASSGPLAGGGSFRMIQVLK